MQCPLPLITKIFGVQALASGSPQPHSGVTLQLRIHDNWAPTLFIFDSEIKHQPPYGLLKLCTTSTLTRRNSYRPDIY